MNTSQNWPAFVGFRSNLCRVLLYKAWVSAVKFAIAGMCHVTVRGSLPKKKFPSAAEYGQFQRLQSGKTQNVRITQTELK